MRRWIATLMLGFLAVSCSGDEGAGAKSTSVATGDAELQAANQRARDSLDSFIERISMPELPSTRSLRARVGTDDEPIWLDEPVYRDGVFSAVVGHIPAGRSDLEIGDVVEVSRGEILDWMYARSGCMAGAYTLRLQRERLPAVKRAEFDAAMFVPFCDG